MSEQITWTLWITFADETQIPHGLNSRNEADQWPAALDWYEKLYNLTVKSITVVGSNGKRRMMYLRPPEEVVG